MATADSIPYFIPKFFLFLEKPLDLALLSTPNHFFHVAMTSESNWDQWLKSLRWEWVLPCIHIMRSPHCNDPFERVQYDCGRDLYVYLRRSICALDDIHIWSSWSSSIQIYLYICVSPRLQEYTKSHEKVANKSCMVHQQSTAAKTGLPEPGNALVWKILISKQHFTYPTSPAIST